MTTQKPKASADKASDNLDNLLDMVTSIVREHVEFDDADGTFEEFEEKILQIGNEVVRRVLEEKLQSIANAFPKQLIIDHNNDWHGAREGAAFKYRRHLRGTVRYHSLVGPLQVSRFTYRECRGGHTSYVPLELSAGLAERMTPKLARCLASGGADVPTRRLKRILVEAGRRPPSRSTLDRGFKDLGSYASVCNDEIEPELRSTETVPMEAKVVVLGLDRTSVPMRPNDERGDYYAGGVRESRPPTVPSSAKGKIQWRMDYVGTFAFVDENGEKILSRQYRAAAHVSPATILERMMGDVQQALTWRPDLRVAVVQDGAPELWNAVRPALEGALLVDSWTEILDWYHLDERLSACAELCHSDPKARAKLHNKWKGALMDGKPISSVTRSLGQATKDADVETKDKASDQKGYFQRQAKRTAYADYKKRGLPIGSGITEGACKSLVQCRVKRSGQRWSQRGLTATLHLRAMQESDRFDAFWPLFSRRYRATSITPLRA